MAEPRCVCRHLQSNHYDGGAEGKWCRLPGCDCKGFTTQVLDIEDRTGKDWAGHNPEEVRTTSSTGGEKGVKPERMSLIPVEALEIMGRLYGFGAQKYAAHNWRKGYEWSKSYDSLQRHASAFWRGEDIDSETGLPHLAGVAFHAFTLMVFMEEQPGFDDRFKKPEVEVSAESFTDVLVGIDPGVPDSEPMFLVRGGTHPLLDGQRLSDDIRETISQFKTVRDDREQKARGNKLLEIYALYEVNGRTLTLEEKTQLANIYLEPYL